MEIIVISDPLYFKAEAWLINQLFEAGMPIFHLRKVGRNRADYAALLGGIDEDYHDRLALHQFHELQADFPLVKRLHYPEQMRKELDAKGLPFPSGDDVLSTSIHHPDALLELTRFEYTFYGPVFNSLSKPGYTGIAEADAGFTLPVKRTGPKIIALGGIDAGKVNAVRAMGFDGLALLGAVWMDKEQALNRFKLIKDKCDSND
ncbi:thiamine-phosphate pyrophosphorylase [Pedobacter sp. AK017]|uniref:thiamine phosphate synthase n=1 Tax=Pedobacter sp. AK017 TaxID=2723073 RepID=UPI00161AEA60|nr:thiamine phosphate synthase [Pedobacter sp. AK017]MBB5437478.1 thiamine-phosphate pyrophosphorylase [Pedobacter sp. AK017]